jgi:hypothetical protein
LYKKKRSVRFAVSQVDSIQIGWKSKSQYKLKADVNEGHRYSVEIYRWH